MADYQEYRRRILHRRWRRVFIIVALLALVALLSAIGILWKVLHRERVDTALSQNTILRQVTTDNTWNTVNYPLARQSVTPSARLQLVPLTKALGPTPL